MQQSVLRKVFFYMLGFGFIMGCVFPAYAYFFVEWKEGLLLFFIAGCIVAGLIVGLVNYQILKSVVIEKIAIIADTNRQVASGDLNVSLHLNSDDKIGEIAQSINNIVGTFQKTVFNIEQISHKIGKASESVSIETEDLYDKSNRMMIYLMEVAESIDELKTIISENSGRIDTINKTYENVNQNTEAGTNMLEKMGEVINRLMESGENIEEVTEVVDEIAFKTNLLSLNATIEAARAGEYGKGFAVVAGEVRKLALSSKESVGKIKEIIRENTNYIQSTSQLFTNSSETLHKVTELVNYSREYFREIQHTAHGQEGKIEGINQSMIELSSVTEKNISSIESLANIAKSLLEISTELVNYIDDMHKKA